MERSVLPATWQLPQELRDRLGHKVGRQRAMNADGHLLLILHRPPMPDEVEREGRVFWRQPDGTWSSSDHGSGPSALTKHLDEYKEVIEKYDQMEEDATSAPEYFSVIDALNPAMRAVRHLHDVLQEARNMCADDRDLLNHRDRAYEIERTAELLYNDAKNSLEFLNAQRAEQHAQSSHRMSIAAHRLNSLAAFFLPLATLSAILDVDPDNIQHHFRNPLFLVATAGIGLFAGWLLMRAVSTATREKTIVAEVVRPKVVRSRGSSSKPLRK